MELINKQDALHAVLHNQGDAAVAAVENIKPIAKGEIVSADRCKLPTLIRDICEQCRVYKYCHRPITLLDALGKEQTDAID